MRCYVIPTKIMRCYGIPTKIVRIVQVMYTNCTCAMVDGDGRTDWFEVKSGMQHVRFPISLGD